VDAGNGDEFTLVVGAVKWTFLELSTVERVRSVCVIREKRKDGIKVLV
jgi:hypothetical protein